LRSVWLRLVGLVLGLGLKLEFGLWFGLGGMSGRENVQSGNVQHSFHIRALRYIRPRVTINAAKSVAVSIVGSRLHYHNSVLYGTFQRNLDRLQHVQN